MILYKSSIKESKLKNELVIVGEGTRWKYPMYVNPTKEQSYALVDRFHQEYPNAPKGEVKVRSTYDKKGNKFEWMAGDSTHSSTEDFILERFGVETNQGWG